MPTLKPNPDAPKNHDEPPAKPAPDDDASTGEKDDPGGTTAPAWLQIGFSIGLAVVFVVLVVILLASAHDADATWQKKVYVFGSVEALVFTAVGWVFGRQVQRGQVAQAQASAKDAKKDAKQNEKKAEHAQQQTEAAQAEAAKHKQDAVEIATASRIGILAQTEQPAPTAPPTGERRGVAQDVGFGDEPQSSQQNQPAPIPPALAAVLDIANRIHPQ